MVIWIIGLSGSGKSTLANAVVGIVRQAGKNVVLLDGDEVREIFGNDLAHTMPDRLRNADRICKLGELLDAQGIHVVCAVLSMFPESRSWNRGHLHNYYEVYIDAPIGDLIDRDSKGLYLQHARGEIAGIAGMDLEFPVPEHPDLVIKNDGAEEELIAHAGAIAQQMLTADYS